MDKAKDKTAEPKGDYFLNKMKTINKNYKDDIRNWRKYGHFLAQNGDFVFKHCKNCDGPMIGHEKEENERKENRIDHVTIKKLEEKTMDKMMDKVEGMTFGFRWKKEKHDKILDKVLVEQDLGKEVVPKQ